MEHTDAAILGAGPTGIGAALRLLELGHWHFLLLDSAASPGGLASSDVDPQGFTWDMGGHVQFSHYRKFDEYMDLAFAREGWLWHERESWIWMKNRFIPYPFQNNLHRLDAKDRWLAVQGLMAAASLHRAPANFEEWILSTFGAGMGGRGAIWRSLAARIPESNLRVSTTVDSVDPRPALSPALDEN